MFQSKTLTTPFVAPLKQIENEQKTPSALKWNLFVYLGSQRITDSVVEFHVTLNLISLLKIS